MQKEPPLLLLIGLTLPLLYYFIPTFLSIFTQGLQAIAISLATLHSWLSIQEEEKQSYVGSSL